MSFESFSYQLSLFESKAQLKQQLQVGKIDQYTFDSIVNSTPKELSKYLGWIGKQVTNNQEVSISHIIYLLSWFEKNKPRIGEKDIERYDLSKIQYIHDNLGKSKSQKEKQTKEEGVKLIDETSTHLLYHVFNYEASCYYGSGTKWCITGKNPNNPEGGDMAWIEYTQEIGADVLFLIKKNSNINDKYYKIALLGKFKGDAFNLVEAYDATDNIIPKILIIKFLKKLKMKQKFNFKYMIPR